MKAQTFEEAILDTKNVTSKIAIQAPTDRVYQAFTSTTDIRKWYGSEARLALRKGGHFTYTDASGDVYESGEYLEVVPNQKLRFSLEHHGYYLGSEVEVSFTASKPTETEISLIHGPLSQDDIKHAQASWDWALSNLKSFIELGTAETYKEWWEGNRGRYS